MNIQFNIMDGLNKTNKANFVDRFVKKYPNAKAKVVEKELTAINKDYKINHYHDKGFIFNWGEMVHGGFNWGSYISSFNIDYPTDFLTIGGNYQYLLDYEEIIWGIHPNIHMKGTELLTQNERYNEAIIICLSERQADDVEGFVSFGYLHGALQVIRNLFNNVEKGDGLWDNFAINRCRYCDDFVADGEKVCKECN